MRSISFLHVAYFRSYRSSNMRFSLDLLTFWRFFVFDSKEQQTSDESISVIFHTYNVPWGLYTLQQDLEIISIGYRENRPETRHISTWKIWDHVRLAVSLAKYKEEISGFSRIITVTLSTNLVNFVAKACLVTKLQVVENATFVVHTSIFKHTFLDFSKIFSEGKEGNSLSTCKTIGKSQF